MSEFKEQILEIYSRIEHVLIPVLKFFLILFNLLFINANIGFNSKASNILIVLLVSVIGAMVPLNVSIILTWVIIVLNLYGHSMPVMAVVGVVLLIMYALYFRFSSKDAVFVLIIPLFCIIKIPYLIAIIAGLLGSLLSFIPVCLGIMIYYMLTGVAEHSDALKITGGGTDDMFTSFKTVIDKVVTNQDMMAVMLAATVIALFTFLLKRLSMDYSWYLGVIVGSVLGIVTIIIGSSVLDTELSIFGSIISIIISAVIGCLVARFVHDVDYSRAEDVQFEDDDYYYYVKVIPKLAKAPEPRRKRSNR